MWSAYVLDVIDAVARTGSFSSAAKELHRVPSAVSYTVNQLEEWLAVPIFERRHRDVVLTPAGEIFIKEARNVIKKMDSTRRLCQQVANGWQGQLSIAVDSIVKPERVEQFILDFYRHFNDVELVIRKEVFNGVWDALADARVDMAIGATWAVPVGERFSFRDMGFMRWMCVAAKTHPLVQKNSPLADEQLHNYPALSLEDTSRVLPKRSTWNLDNQPRMVVPDWDSGLRCLIEGLCIGMIPAHRVQPLIKQGKLCELKPVTPLPDSPCCVTWVQNSHSPILQWVLDYLGDSATLNKEWLE